MNCWRWQRNRVLIAFWVPTGFWMLKQKSLFFPFAPCSFLGQIPVFFLLKGAFSTGGSVYLTFQHDCSHCPEYLKGHSAAQSAVVHCMSQCYSWRSQSCARILLPFPEGQKQTQKAQWNFIPEISSKHSAHTKHALHICRTRVAEQSKQHPRRAHYQHSQLVTM